MPDPGTVLSRLTERLAPLERALHDAFWTASTDASPKSSAARQRAEEALLAALGDPELFAEVKGALAGTGAAAGLTRRALEQASLDLLANQIPEGDRAELVALQAKVEHAFSTVRGRVGGRELAYNALERTLDEVELATREPFLAAKAELDARLSARFGVAADELSPWHYGDLFFQRYDGEDEADLGPLLEGADTVGLTVATYDSMGLETRHLLERSDLHPRSGKDQHAFCLDVDRAGDIRVLANLAPGEEWLDVLLHEVGHAVYDDHIDRSLPWVLRRPPQSLVTEAVALMLGRLRRDPEFLVGVLGADKAAAAALTGPSREVLRTGQLVFARWCLVVIRFERALYADPGADLATTWWDLVASLQGLRRPSGRTAPDWASKIHLAVAPVYYQSYLLGELLASQLDQAVRAHAGGFVGRPEAGAFLAERVFAPGATRPWRDLVASATGSPLGPAAFLAGLAA